LFDIYAYKHKKILKGLIIPFKINPSEIMNIDTGLIVNPEDVYFRHLPDDEFHYNSIPHK